MPSDPTVRPAAVLVVEDESMVRTVAVDMLEDAGLPVLQAATADAAWAILERAEAIGVLFTDIDMPGSMDGLALATQVAELWPYIRLVVASSRVTLRDADMPADGRFLLKPYRQAQLLKAIDTAA
ncbi:response regulator [uncultured Methylobacterium sp.]|uniref:response regulator n=1 Tax=uncultured Methylobacterium sp. TaxID=157278 RepID=UPI0025913D81|nr:response regulator [uncultured Methylobacterium sp.]